MKHNFVVPCMILAHSDRIERSLFFYSCYKIPKHEIIIEEKNMLKHLMVQSCIDFNKMEDQLSPINNSLR